MRHLDEAQRLAFRIGVPETSVCQVRMVSAPPHPRHRGMHEAEHVKRMRVRSTSPTRRQRQPSRESVTAVDRRIRVRRTLGLIRKRLRSATERDAFGEHQRDEQNQ